MPDPRIGRRIKTANEILLDRAIRHSVRVERYKAWLFRELTGQADGVFEDILTNTRRRLESSVGVPLGKARWQALIQSNGKIVTNGYNGLHKSTVDQLKQFCVTEAEWARASLRAAAPITFEFSVPSAATLKALVDKTPMQGRFLKDWFQDLAAETQGKVSQAINLGIARGDPAVKVVRALKGTARLNYADGILPKASRAHLQTVVKTAVIDTSARATEATAEANTDVVKGVQWVSTLDGQTSLTCQELDGQFFNLGEGERPPAHMNCRSRVVMVTKSWKEMGIALKDAPEGTRASMNGEVPAKLTYRDWIAQQPAAVQNEALGVGRAKLFREGVPLDRFTTQDHRPLSLEDIQRSLERNGP